MIGCTKYHHTHELQASLWLRSQPEEQIRSMWQLNASLLSHGLMCKVNIVWSCQHTPSKHLVRWWNSLPPHFFGLSSDIGECLKMCAIFPTFKGRECAGFTCDSANVILSMLVCQTSAHYLMMLQSFNNHCSCTWCFLLRKRWPYNP